MDADFSAVTALAVDLGKVGPRVVRQAQRAVEAATRGTERDAKLGAAVDTGTMRSSITSDIKALSGEVGPTVDYAEYVEYGTSRMAPQPFMGPATDRNAALFYKAMESINPGLT